MGRHRPPEERPIIHYVPRYDDDGELDGVKWCRTVTAAKTFARDQAERLGRGGYMFGSLEFRAVARLLGTVDVTEVLNG